MANPSQKYLVLVSSTTSRKEESISAQAATTLQEAGVALFDDRDEMKK